MRHHTTAAGNIPFTPEEEAEFDAMLANPIQAIPNCITMTQARLYLLRIGLLDELETVITAQGREAQILWEYAGIVERNNPIVNHVLVQQGYSSEQIDGLFIAASLL